MNNHLLLFVLIFFLGGGFQLPAQAQSELNSACGPLRSPGQLTGPFDFRTDKSVFGIVISRHFTPAVEALVRGNTTYIGGDIDYTLIHIPNHPNALVSMMRLAEREKTSKPRGSSYSVECWFDRAIRFRPDDNVVRMIYASFLIKNNRKADAMGHLKIVLDSAEENAFTHQNVGLLYFDLGEYPLALKQAQRAIELGLNRPALREKLQSVGQWTEPIADTSKTVEPNPSLENKADALPR